MFCDNCAKQTAKKLISIFSKNDGKIEKELFQQMLQNSTTRFYQEERVWIDGQIGLAQRHRYNTPESKYISLPFSSKQNTIVADCRIDNREELAEKLAISEIQLAELADAHLILRAYEKWGENCVLHLIGDFAFAIWDAEKETIFLAKDPVGIKRLYYYDSPEFFAFANSFTSLLALPQIPKEIDTLTAYRFFARDGVHGERTFVEGVHSLLAGHSLTVNKDKSELKQYWVWEDQLQPLNLNSEAEYVAEAQRLFEQSVQARLRSNKPVASELSGGLDCSGIISYVVGKIQPKKTFHVFANVEKTPTDPNIINERNHIDQVLEKFPQLIPHFIDEDSHKNLEKDMKEADQILGYPNNTMLAIFGLPQMREMYKNDIGVLFSGYGGDQCVSYRGDRDLHELIRQNEWSQIIKAVRNPQHQTAKYKAKVVAEQLLKPLFPETARKWLRKKTAPKIVKGRGSFLNPDFSEKGKIAHERHTVPTTSISQLERVVHIGQLHTFHSFQAISDYHGAEHRFPMLDVRLLNLFAQIPVQMRIKNGTQRYLYRKVMEPYTPKQVTWRKDKAGNIAPGVKTAQKKQRKVTAEEFLKLSEKYDLSAVFQEEEIEKWRKADAGASQPMSFYRFIDSISD
ncbi:MAG: asparagine synthase (glutamine-hydrolyzing) [Flammeovirgaceae bacterium]|jgi:asparagine synthase (glutamine-hydrolysing)